MKVLFVVSEINPIIKSGGLADVVGVLPRELDRLGVEVRIALPDYKFLNRSQLKYAHNPTVHKISSPRGKIDCLVSQVSHPDIPNPIYLFKTGEGLTTSSLYPKPDEPDQDRFLIFSLGVIEWLKTSDWQPDIVHGHDWMAGAIPQLIEQNKLPYGSLLTVHNAAYQGVMPTVYFDELGVKVSSVAPQTNLLRMGITTATKLNTVSPTYAKEVLTTDYGFGLENTFAKRKTDFTGILNGLDYDRYSPESNEHLSRPYNADTVIEAKSVNKAHLRDRVSLPANPDAPLYAVVARLDDQKGLSLIETAIKSTPLLKHGQLVILGEGDAYWERRFKLLAEQNHNLSVVIAFDEALAHQIYAASDFVLVPSKYEPCGLTQMIAMSFGAIPIVRRTGGLADTVIDLRQNPQAGTGIVFNAYEVKEFTQSLGASMGLYQNKDQLLQVITRAMSQQFSWEDSAQKYVALYEQARKR